MYIVPKDSRQRYTKQCLYDAFLNALETKQVSSITVSEISKESGISRKTFYKYYSDPFALLFALEEDLFVGLIQELETLPPVIFDIVPALIRFTAEHKTLMRAAFENQRDDGFIDQVMRYIYDTYHVQWENANPLMPQHDVEYLFHYVVSGVIGIIRYWLLRDPELPVEEMIEKADFLMRLSEPK